MLSVITCDTGHIGQTSPTPREMALDDFIARRYASGFVAPNYTFDTKLTDDGAQTAELKEFAGRDALMSRLHIKVPPYDDKTFKFWCYDTPGLINPQQVGKSLEQYDKNKRFIAFIMGWILHSSKTSLLSISPLSVCLPFLNSLGTTCLAYLNEYMSYISTSFNILHCCK